MPEQVLVDVGPVQLSVRPDDEAVERHLDVETQARLTWAELHAEGMTAIRWWTIDEILGAADTRFGPPRLGILLRELVRGGPPVEALDVGV